MSSTPNMKKQTWEEKLWKYRRMFKDDKTYYEVENLVRWALSDHDRELDEGLEGIKKVDNNGKVNFGDASAYNHGVTDAQEFIKKGK